MAAQSRRPKSRPPSSRSRSASAAARDEATPPPAILPAGEPAGPGRDTKARVVLRQGRARPLWFGHPYGKAKHSGFTFDAGMVARASTLTIGVVGYNLRDLSSVHAPLALGYGLALQPVPDLTFVVDGYHDFTTYDATRGTLTTVSGGGEYVAQRRLAVRAGGGRDGVSGHGFLSAGLAVLSEIGSVDAGIRQDISGDARLTFFAAGLRLFVPAPQP